MTRFLLPLPASLTYKPGTGWITTYSTIAREHLQALPESPHRVRIDKKGAWLRIASPIDLIVGEQIIICTCQPILQCAIITPWIPSSYGNIAKDWRMRKVKLGLGDHLQSLIVNRQSNCQSIPMQWAELQLARAWLPTWEFTTRIVVLLPTSTSCPRVGAWLNLMTMSCVSVCAKLERNNTSDIHWKKFDLQLLPINLPSLEPARDPALETIAHVLMFFTLRKSFWRGKSRPKGNLLKGGSLRRSTRTPASITRQVEG